MKHSTTIVLLLLAIPATNSHAQDSLPKFRAQTIDSQVIIGYGTAIGDVDGDGKPDILLADKQQFAWYENPTWKRHVIAKNLTAKDNVCIAARDIDGDGKVEIAVGGQWDPGDTFNSGSVHYLVAPEDRTQEWTPIELQHEPVVHRMRWLRISKERFALVVAPLHGRANKGGAGDGARLLAYHKPDDPHENWKTEILDDEFHVTHNFDVIKWEADDESESVLYLGKEGAKLIKFNSDKWISKRLNQVNGGGEIRLGQQSNKSNFIATIEPFHGTHLAVYHRTAPDQTFDFANRVVLDESFNQGHAIAVADFMGTGSQQIVAGWRMPNADGRFGVKLYYETGEMDGVGASWNSIFVDENEMACEDLRVGDLNGDGRPDIVASGRSTHNLKIYWNER